MGSSCVWLLLRLIVLLLPISGSVIQIHGLGIGINYGQIANNLPTPSRVSTMLQSLNISRVKLYDADPKVLLAFANTNVEFIVGLGNDLLQSMSDLATAQNWVEQHVQTFLPQTRITCILVGNEVFKSNPQLMSSLLPAMRMVYNALVNLGLDKQVTVTSAHSLDVLASSYPPSNGTFREDIAVYMQPLLNFHSKINSPFLVNAYPYFAYKGSPSQVSLEYVLFQPNQGMTDPSTNLVYDNMLYAQIDAVYAAIKAMGHTDIQVRVSETGWPSKGDSDEPGANPENAGLYNGNLLRRIQEKQATPGKPSVPVDVYVFALFNEDQKPGPTSERNYGLYYPDGSPVYNVGLQGYLPVLTYSSATKLQALSVLGVLFLFTIYLI